MTYIISAILIVSNYFTSMFKNRSNLIRTLLLAVMWVLFWGNYDNVDYNNYQLHYNHVIETGSGFSSSQVGYTAIMRVAVLLHFDYNQFLIIVSTLGLLLITSTVRRYTTKPGVVYALYFIHPFLLDIVQTKHFLAMAIIVYCFRYLERDGKMNVVKYVIGILLASTIHSIAIIYLPIIFIRNLKIKTYYQVIFFYLIVVIPLTYTNILSIIAYKFFPTQGLDSYFSNRANFGFFIQYFVQGSILLMLLVAKRYLEKCDGENKFVTLVYKINIYMMILFPLYIINGNFERPFRMMMIPNYIVFSKLFMKIKRKERAQIMAFMLFVVISMFLFYVFISTRDKVFYPIFEKNLVLT